jgi:nucleoid-associated protein YgaU
LAASHHRRHWHFRQLGAAEQRAVTIAGIELAGSPGGSRAAQPGRGPTQRGGKYREAIAPDKNVPQDYVWPGEESAPKNQHGSKAGATVVAASLHDRPGWNKDMKYNFETVARSDDTGTYYGGMNWGFSIKSSKVVDEHHSVSEAPSLTFQAAVTKFNEFYKNTHTVMQGDTLESLAVRYLGDKAKADSIYDANKAKIPDKGRLPVGVQLVIPGVSATGT